MQVKHEITATGKTRCGRTVRTNGTGRDCGNCARTKRPATGITVAQISEIKASNPGMDNGQAIKTLTSEAAKYNLFYRATSLGYDKDAAMDVAETVQAYEYVTDPCAKHPGMSTTITRQGYAADGCEACEVIELTGGDAFSQADEIERLRRLEEPTPAERAEDALKIFVGSDITDHGAKGMIKSVGYGQVTIHTHEGADAGYSKIYPCQSIVARILGGQITIMRDGQPDCACDIACTAGAPNLPEGGFACPGCGWVFVAQDTDASADVLARSEAVIKRNQASQVGDLIESGAISTAEGSSTPREEASPFMRTLRGLLTLDM